MVKLGKLPAKKDPRTLKLSRYFMPQLPEPPGSQALDLKVPHWPMHLNDQIGDCAIVTCANAIRCWSHNDDDAPDIEPTDDQVVAGYMRCGGYVPGNPATDNGCVMLDVMKIWQHEGLCERKIGAYASITPRDHQTLCQGVYLFGALAIGLALPLAIQGLSIWDAPGRFHARRPRWRKGSWGGHAVTLVGYDQNYLTVVTWGGLQRMTWRFWDLFADEAFAAISPDWLGADGISPNDFDGASLAADLAALR